MRVGVLTGGGDCPGLNAVLRAVVRRGIHRELDMEFVGFRDGWRGVMEGTTMPLNTETTAGILHRGGTILGTSRTNPFKSSDGVDQVRQTLSDLDVEGLVPIGGGDTLGVGAKLSKEGVKVVGVPKTIDNDLMVTDFTFGFDTAINIVTEAVDRLRTTTESHRRIMVVETMGRHAGWIACFAGIAVAAGTCWRKNVDARG